VIKSAASRGDHRTCVCLSTCPATLVVVPDVTPQPGEPPYRPRLKLDPLWAEKLVSDLQRTNRLASLAGLQPQLDAIKTTQLLGSSGALKTLAGDMQRTNRLASFAALKPQLDAFKATHALAASRPLKNLGIAVVAAPEPLVFDDDPATFEGSAAGFIETCLLLAAWYRALPPKHERNVTDAFLGLIVVTAYLISAATGSRFLLLTTDGLALTLAVMVACSRALDTFED
jgi:hypothetical protein